MPKKKNTSEEVVSKSGIKGTIEARNGPDALISTPAQTIEVEVVSETHAMKDMNGVWHKIPTTEIVTKEIPAEAPTWHNLERFLSK